MLEKITLRHITVSIVALKVAMAIYLVLSVWSQTGGVATFHFDWTFLAYLLTGFIAQLIDGALGMAHGVNCTTLLFHFGVSPAVATAAVSIRHTLFTAGCIRAFSFVFGQC